jgi:hypothetical protein
MTNTFSFISQRNVLVTFLLAGFFFLVGLNNTNAQQVARGAANPYPEIAESFDVTAYDLSHFDRDHAIEVLSGIYDPLRHLHGLGTHQEELQAEYIGNVLSDVKEAFIAVEISLLTRLEELKSNKHLGGTSNQLQGGQQYTQLTNLYNSTVSSLQ